MASNAGWDKTVPSGTSSIADGDDDIRSFKSSMQAWWEQEHYATDGSANSAGIAKHGAGRAFVGTASQLSNPTADNDGRLFFVTDDNTLRVGNVSTSSWSLLADNVTLSSNNSWTGTNTFDDARSSSGATLGPRITEFRFSRSNIASSASVAAGRLFAGGAGADEFSNNPVTGPRSGHVTGISAVFSANITAGSLRITPVINNTVSTYSVTMDSSTDSKAWGGAGHVLSDTTAPGFTIPAGALLGLFVDGDASLAPSGTGDLNEIVLEVTYDD